MSMKKVIMQAAAFAMLASAGVMDNPYGTPRFDNTKPYPKSKSLPKWKVGDSIIHAKDENTAIKYAKKRGLWKDGMAVSAV